MSKCPPNLRPRFRFWLPLLLILSFLQLPTWSWSAAARAETLASYPAAGELPLLAQTGPVLPFLELNQGPGLQIPPDVTSGEFLGGAEFAAWNALNIALALSLFQIYNQHDLAGPGAALAAGMILLTPLAAGVMILLGTFVLMIGTAFGVGDNWLVNGFTVLSVVSAVLLPIGVFLLGLSWLPPNAQTPAFKTQLLSF